MMHGYTRHPPLDELDLGAVSLAHFARLREEVGEQTLRRFVLAHLVLLPGRLERIERTRGVVHAAAVVRVVLDLRTSGAILGARRLPGLLSDLEATLNAGLPTGFAQIKAVRTEAAAVAAELRSLLSGGDRAGPKVD